MKKFVGVISILLVMVMVSTVWAEKPVRKAKKAKRVVAQNDGYKLAYPNQFSDEKKYVKAWTGKLITVYGLVGSVKKEGTQYSYAVPEAARLNDPDKDKRTAWFLVEYTSKESIENFFSQHNEKKNIAYSKLMYAARCGKRTLAMVTNSSYSRNGDYISVNWTDINFNVFEPVVPDSLGEVIYDVICWNRPESD